MQGQKTAYIYRKSVNNVAVNIAISDYFQKPKLCLSPNIENGKLPVPVRYVVNQRNIKPILFVRRIPEITIQESVELLVPRKLDD